MNKKVSDTKEWCDIGAFDDAEVDNVVVGIESEALIKARVIRPRFDQRGTVSRIVEQFGRKIEGANVFSVAAGDSTRIDYDVLVIREAEFFSLVSGISVWRKCFQVYSGKQFDSRLIGWDEVE